ncbi:hypothetical protein C8P63_110134 [Melghirimyces profundicolus]|uniref:Uncharacterized protein n=1 Tax=Melghirimyces profundicolus TaxID=1242148 RepID=A0A2T6BV86_9BACL|nr:hypothetical protein C8P63_110134 [Melghirimyces profundicolus]
MGNFRPHVAVDALALAKHSSPPRESEQDPYELLQSIIT